MARTTEDELFEELFAAERALSRAVTLAEALKDQKGAEGFTAAFYVLEKASQAHTGVEAAIEGTNELMGVKQ